MIPVPRTPSWDPRIDPAGVHTTMWDLGCGSAPLSSAYIDRAGKLGYRACSVTVDIDKDRDALGFGYTLPSTILHVACPQVRVMESRSLHAP